MRLLLSSCRRLSQRCHNAVTTSSLPVQHDTRFQSPSHRSPTLRSPTLRSPPPPTSTLHLHPPIICLQFLLLKETNCPSEGDEGRKKRRERERESHQRGRGRIGHGEPTRRERKSDKRNRHGSVFCPTRRLDVQRAERITRSHVTPLFSDSSGLSFARRRSRVLCSSSSGPRVCQPAGRLL